MSQSNNKTRRTPLTLGQSHPKHGNSRKNSSDSGDSNKISGSSVVDKIASNDINPKVELTKLRVDAHVAAKDKAKENGSNQQHKHGNGTKNGSGGGGGGASVEKAVAAVAPTQKDSAKEVAVKNSKKEETEKKEEKKQREDKETPKKEEKAAKNGSDDNSVSKNTEHSDGIRESPRQKEIREKEELERSKEQERKEIDAANAVFKSQEEVASLPAPTVTVTPATPDVKSVVADSPTPKKRSSAHSTPAKSSPGNQTPTRPNVADPSLSLLQQSELYGFGPDVDEMESLRMETDTGFGDSPMPPKSVGKVLKFSQSPAPNRARVSPFRRVAETNASTFVNLSTVSELSTEANSPAVVVVGASVVPGEQSYGSYRHITGRKGTKPLREVTLQHTMRESYRRIKTDLDDSFSSVNATMGSEINNSSFSTPVIAVKGRKRTNIGGSEPDLTTVTESPKKPRLDFSGFLGIMASPVTLLRNKFSRTSLLCSTPHAKKLNVNAAEPEEEEADVDQASGVVVDVEMATVDLTEDEVPQPNKTDIDVDVASTSSNTLNDSLDVVPIDANEIVIETEQLKSVDDIKDKIAEEEARQDEAEAIAGTSDAPKKGGRCAIM